MILGIPLAIWFGILTIICLFVTAIFGAVMFYLKKPVFKYHKAFAGLTCLFAIIHLVLGVLLWFYGVVI